MFEYDRGSGSLLWKVKRSNRVKIGEEPKHINNTGYRQVSIDGTSYLVHRLVWFIETGTWPTSLDHINGVRLDNRISNLREATSSQNNANRIKPSNKHSSDYKGVYWHKQRGKWHVQLQSGGRKVNCGLYTSELEAAVAYNKKALEIHGPFAKLNDIDMEI